MTSITGEEEKEAILDACANARSLKLSQVKWSEGGRRPVWPVWLLNLYGICVVGFSPFIDGLFFNAGSSHAFGFLWEEVLHFWIHWRWPRFVAMKTYDFSHPDMAIRISTYGRLVVQITGGRGIHVKKYIRTSKTLRSRSMNNRRIRQCILLSRSSWSSWSSWFFIPPVFPPRFSFLSGLHAVLRNQRPATFKAVLLVTRKPASKPVPPNAVWYSPELTFSPTAIALVSSGIVIKGFGAELLSDSLWFSGVYRSVLGWQKVPQKVSPTFQQGFTQVSPRFHQGSTKVSRRFHQGCCFRKGNRKVRPTVPIVLYICPPVS